MEANPLTLLTEVDAHEVRLWTQDKERYEEVRELFVSKEAVTQAREFEIPIGGGETETELRYEDPTNEQVPSLKSLLEYLAQTRPPGEVHKHYHTRRKEFRLQDGDYHTHLRNTQKHITRRQSIEHTDTHITHKRLTTERTHRNSLVVDQHFALNRRIDRRHTTVIDSPVFVLVQKNTRNVKVIRPIVILQNQ